MVHPCPHLSSFHPVEDMSPIPFFSLGNSERYCCYDSLLRTQKHGPEQRYMSPTTGRCRRLRVQAVKPVPRTNQVKITDGSSRASKLAVWLIKHYPKSVWQIIPWLGRYLWFMVLLVYQPFDAPVYTGFYHAYQMQYWGQLWAARSPKEYSIRIRELIGHGMPTPAGVTVTTRSITHGTHPRLLVVHGKDGWSLCDDPEVIIHEPYIAISYRQSDVFQRGTDEKGLIQEQEQKRQFREMVRATTLASGYSAYWLDLECLGESPAEKNLDLYRMADIYRGAAFTLITLRKSDNAHSIESWRSWGGRVWTLPEALLSSKLRYKIGFDGDVTPISLHELANKAYERYDEETAIINSYSGKDPLERLERLTLLKAAIWRRGSAALPQKPEQRLQSQQEKQLAPAAQVGFAYPAEKVYALMGFFEHRIMPNPLETELQALARLSMANDNDRIAERMVSMLPDPIPPQACWYADTDAYESNLWEIEPEIQVAGVTQNGALVLDGCRAAAIRWKNFPDVAFQTTPSIRRSLAGQFPYFAWVIFASGLPTMFANRVGGGVLVAAALVLMIAAPFLIAYANSGRVVSAEPWLIGVKGVLTREEASMRLYGGAISHFPRVSYTPSGSQFALAADGTFREGDPAQFTHAEDPRYCQDIYTLVDTLSGTLYYFRAARPPTVCLFTGREGGMGRFVLCSESCTINQLHKETVVRMPSYISRAMVLCDWVALGGIDDQDSVNLV